MSKLLNKNIVFALFGFTYVIYFLSQATAVTIKNSCSPTLGFSKTRLHIYPDDYVAKLELPQCIKDDWIELAKDEQRDWSGPFCPDPNFTYVVEPHGIVGSTAIFKNSATAVVECKMDWGLCKCTTIKQ
jgi:hypothetical protein